MLVHILITLFLSTYISPWNTASTPTHATILVFLYYVIPLIVLLFFYLVFNEFINLQTAHITKKQAKKHSRKTDKVSQAKKRGTTKQRKKQSLPYDCYTPINKSSKKNED